MYLTYYELNKKPFQISADPMFLWMGEKHKEALAMLKYGIMDNRGFIMLTGDVGTGKTTLINALTNNLGPGVVIANITNPGLKQIEFLNHLSVAFGLNKKYSRKVDFLVDFQVFLEKCFRDGKQALLIIDEAQRLSQVMLEEIRLLSNIEHQDVKLLNIFFVGQDELNGILERHENRALRQRMTLHYHLEPLSEDEIGKFIEHRLKIAGAGNRIFNQDAVKEIYLFSKGYPRLTNIICDHAMLAGYVANKKNIGAAEIRDCAKDLKLPRINTSKPATEVPVNQPRLVVQKYEQNKMSSYTYLLPYITGFLFAILLICFLYFPIRAGASFSDILNYWMDQIRQPKIAISKQVTTPLESQAAFRVTQQVNHEEAERRGGGEAGRLEGKDSGKSGRAEESKSGSIEETEGSQSKLPPSIQASELPSSLVEDPDAGVSQPIISESEKRYRLTFGFDSNDLTPSGYERLNKTAELMKFNPEVNLIIEGHTDAVGTRAYNAMLSKFRADIVKNYLVTKGISPNRITSIGKGAEEPLSGNDDLRGRRANRRVDIEMVF